MSVRTEDCLLRIGTGRMVLRGDASTYGLFVDNEPFFFYWPPSAESTGREMYRFAPNLTEEMVPPLRITVSRLPDTGLTLFYQILPVLQRLPNGPYTLTLSETTHGEWQDEYSADKNGDTYRDAQYPFSGYSPRGGTVLLATQPSNWLDGDRVDYFLRLIESGQRPFAITVSIAGADFEFILDGHHKLMAYAYADIPAWRLCIQANRAEKMQVEDWIRDIPHAGKVRNNR